MKIYLVIGILTVVCNIIIAQDYTPTPEQIAEEKRLKQVKQQFLDEEFEEVAAFYDSLTSKKLYTQMDVYKMANMSYIELSKNSDDSLKYTTKANTAYSEAIKWYGPMHIKERWDSIKIEIPEEPEVFQIVDQNPEPIGGFAAFYKYVGEEMQYPEEARRLGIEGKVLVQFVVTKTGSLEGVNVIEGIGSGCDEEALRVIQNAPNWNAGKQEGEPVYVRMVVPITFKASGKPKKKKKK